MTSEVQRIPPAPRHVSWRKVLGYRWPLAAATFALLIYGGVMTWMLFLANSRDVEQAARLERGPRLAADAVVTAVDPAAVGDTAVPRQLVTYEFRASGHQFTGTGTTKATTLRERSPIAIEYLSGTPSISRIQGTTVDTHAGWFDPSTAFAALVVPGLVLGLGYLAGVFHLRRVLAHGDVGIATVTLVVKVRGCVPECYGVRYAFKDHRARDRGGYHWVRAHSPLGERLLTMMRHGRYDKVPVLHDRRFPQHSRLVLPDDFSPDPRPIDPSATIRL